MYDEKDLKTILSRAIQIQKQNEGSGYISGSIEKLSLSEIEEIARESGLSPDYVREAAFELEGIPQNVIPGLRIHGRRSNDLCYFIANG